MGIRKTREDECEYCPICGLVISTSEYVAMCWLEKDMTYERRKVFCGSYHQEFRKREKQNTYDYRRSFFNNPNKMTRLLYKSHITDQNGVKLILSDCHEVEVTWEQVKSWQFLEKEKKNIMVVEALN